MKKFQQLSQILFLATVFAFTSCSSDSEGGSVNAADGTITAKVDGQTVTSAKALTQASLTTGQFSMLAMQGTDMNGDGISISIAGYTGVGKYEVGGGSSVFAVCTYIDKDMSNPTDPNMWTGPYDEAALVGYVDITEQTDTKIKGTFQFKAKNQKDGSIKEITDGSFNIKVTKY